MRARAKCMAAELIAVGSERSLTFALPVLEADVQRAFKEAPRPPRSPAKEHVAPQRREERRHPRGGLGLGSTSRGRPSACALLGDVELTAHENGGTTGFELHNAFP